MSEKVKFRSKILFVIIGIILLSLPVQAQQVIQVDSINTGLKQDWLPLRAQIIEANQGIYVIHPFKRILIPLLNSNPVPQLELDLEIKQHSGPVYVEIENDIDLFFEDSGQFYLKTWRIFAFDKSGGLVGKLKMAKKAFRSKYYPVHGVIHPPEQYGNTLADPGSGIIIRNMRRQDLEQMVFKPGKSAKIDLKQERLILIYRIEKSEAGFISRIRYQTSISGYPDEICHNPKSLIFSEFFSMIHPDRKSIFISFVGLDKLFEYDFEGKLIQAKSFPSLHPKNPAPEIPENFEHVVFFENYCTTDTYTNLYFSNDANVVYRTFSQGMTESGLEKIRGYYLDDQLRLKAQYIQKLHLNSGQLAEYSLPGGYEVITIVNDIIYARLAVDRPGNLTIYKFKFPN